MFLEGKGLGSLSEGSMSNAVIDGAAAGLFRGVEMNGFCFFGYAITSFQKILTPASEIGH